MRFTLTAATLALAATASGFSTQSVSLNSAVGSSVAGAVGAGLGSTGWSWGLGDSSHSSSSSKRSDETPAKGWLSSNVNLYHNRISSNPDNVVLTSDPAGGSGQVLSIKYAANSYGLHTSPSGGTSFYSQPFLGSNGARTASSNPFVSATRITSNASSASRNELLLAYSVYFPEDFDFVKGGKLPGLYSSVGTSSGGSLDADTSGCEGGSEGGVGSTCWSTRIMWRANGQAEIYAYIPTSLAGTDYQLCPAGSTTAKGSKLICNSDYGTSIGRGAFSFQKGKWNDVALHVKLNSDGKADGLVELYFNGEAKPSIHLSGIVFRKDSAKPFVDKIMATSFFGGSGSEWATPNAVQTYFKNVALFAGPASGSGGASGGSSGSHSSAASSSASSSKESPTASKSKTHSASSTSAKSKSKSHSASSTSAKSKSKSHSASSTSATSKSKSHSVSSTSLAPSSSKSKSRHSSVSASATSSLTGEPTSSSSVKGGKCHRKKVRPTSRSEPQPRRRGTRAERAEAIRARTDAQAGTKHKKRIPHHRSPHYMRARNGVWA